MATGTTPPDRNERQACWDARDAYFGCLDEKGIIAPGDEGRACLVNKKAFERDCVKSWVVYFAKRRVMEARQKLMQERQPSMPSNGTNPSPAGVGQQSPSDPSKSRQSSASQTSFGDKKLA